MYKCKECGNEFKVKPDFCDCGNDTFDCLGERNIQENTESENKQKITFSERYPEIEKLKKSIDPISLVIFITCILLSILSILFLGNNLIKNEEIIQENKPVKNIKNIDSFWDNSLPKVVENKNSEEKKENLIEKVLLEKPIVKKVNPSLPTASKNKSVNQTKKTSSTPKVTSKAVKTQNRTHATVSKKTTNDTKSKNVQFQQKAELERYKIGLRNSIFYKIDFTSVVGDGTCSLSFSIDERGKLVNRKFTKKSGNVTLNDAVYKGMMSFPYYKVPPSSYNGETLKLTINFQNGSYEIGLK